MRIRLLLLLVLCGPIVQRAALHAQETTIDPPVLYSDRNTITIRDPDGIREIIAVGGPLMRVDGAGPGSCDNSRTLDVFVNTASVPIALQIIVLDCAGNEQSVELGLATVWTLDINDLGVTEVGNEICKEFSVRAMGNLPVVLDDITVDDPNVTLRLPTSLPIAVPGGDNYVYMVCYDASETGVHTFPVVTWIRRDFPSAGQTSYPVADTGYVLVREPQQQPLTDPTTFRSLAIPNAVIPRKGRLYAGVYDLLGLTAGYAFDDHFMVIAGGMLPTPDDWGGNHGEMFGAYSVGVKIGLQPTKRLHIAAGYQYGKSTYDKAATPLFESEIVVNAPYAAVSWGDDDDRTSITAGYAFKRHTAVTPLFDGTPFIREFDRNAFFVGVGGDTRIGRHWKVVAEAAYMQTAGVVPVLAGLRYFGHAWAIDAGLAYLGIVDDGGTRPAIPLAPVLSGIYVFGM